MLLVLGWSWTDLMLVSLSVVIPPSCSLHSAHKQTQIQMEKIAFLSLLQWITPGIRKRNMLKHETWNESFLVLLSATSLICYTSADASEYKFCNEHDGFNTCYASYDKCKDGASTNQKYRYLTFLISCRWSNNRSRMLHETKHLWWPQLQWHRL